MPVPLAIVAAQSDSYAEPRYVYVPDNVLALPLAHITMEVSNNEDWVDSLVYVVTTGPAEPYPQMDLRRIRFEMMLRRRPQDHEVILDSGILAGALTVGSPPNFGHLIWHFSRSVMRRVWPGEYVGDVIAKDQRFERAILTVNLTVVHGVTR